MTLVASDAVFTLRGDKWNTRDGFIASFEVGDHYPASGSGKTETSEHTLLTVGNCVEIYVDYETGAVALTTILHYINLLPAISVVALKEAVSIWFKKPVSVSISRLLISRDRGVSFFKRTEDGTVDFLIHPAQLLANVDVGINTRPWLISAAAFVLSYSKITAAFRETPQDFARIEEHIASLQARISVLNNTKKRARLAEKALDSVIAPYPDFNYRSVSRDAISRLALFARADLAVLEDIRDKMKGKEVESSDILTLNITQDHLRFLNGVIATNGDLWASRSAHTYTLGEQNGAIIVLPSGHLYTVLAASGVSTRRLMKSRTALSRFESLIPYIPYDYSGYSGDISRLALIEAEKNKKKTVSKADLETAKTTIANFAAAIAIAVIISPELMKYIEEKVSSAPSVVEEDSEAEDPPLPPKIKVKAPAAQVPASKKTGGKKAAAAPPPEPEAEEDEEVEETEE